MDAPERKAEGETSPIKNTGSIPVNEPVLALRNMEAAWRREAKLHALKPARFALEL
jgi:hypothetical protein